MINQTTITDMGVEQRVKETASERFVIKNNSNRLTANLRLVWCGLLLMMMGLFLPQKVHADWSETDAFERIQVVHLFSLSEPYLEFNYPAINYNGIDDGMKEVHISVPQGEIYYMANPSVVQGTKSYTSHGYTVTYYTYEESKDETLYCRIRLQFPSGMSISDLKETFVAFKMDMYYDYNSSFYTPTHAFTSKKTFLYSSSDPDTPVFTWQELNMPTFNITNATYSGTDVTLTVTAKDNNGWERSALQYQLNNTGDYVNFPGGSDVYKTTISNVGKFSAQDACFYLTTKKSYTINNVSHNQSFVYNLGEFPITQKKMANLKATRTNQGIQLNWNMSLGMAGGEVWIKRHGYGLTEETVKISDANAYMWENCSYGQFTVSHKGPFESEPDETTENTIDVEPLTVTDLKATRTNEGVLLEWKGTDANAVGEIWIKRQASKAEDIWFKMPICQSWTDNSVEGATYVGSYSVRYVSGDYSSEVTCSLEPPFVDGYYEISTSDQLLWYLNHYSNETNITDNARLVADIVINDGTFASDGSYNPGTSGKPLDERFANQAILNGATFDGQGHCITGLYINSPTEDIGLFSKLNNGSVKKLTLRNGYLNGTYYLGAIVGGMKGMGSEISNCAVVNTVVKGTQYIGGLCGFFAGHIKHSLSLASVSGNEYTGTIFGYGPASNISNCYDASVDPDRMKSGEIAFLLQGDQKEQIWGESIGTDSIPHLGGTKVYGLGNCPNDLTSYTNAKPDKELAHTYDNGFCEYCDAYEKPTEKDGVYQIANAGQLYWFAGLVNGTLAGVDRNDSANAILTDHIIVNPTDGWELWNTETTGLRTWKPIGNYKYEYLGTFNGNNHTISGLFVANSESGYTGLWGILEKGGVIENLGVTASFIHGQYHVGGICADNLGTINNCFFTGSVWTDASEVFYAGGVCAINVGTIQNCYSVATVSGGQNAGGVAGQTFGTASIVNCYCTDGLPVFGENKGTGTITQSESKSLDQFKSGEVAYLLAAGNTTNNAWGQNLDKETIPQLGGMAVYRYTNCVDKANFTNDAEMEGKTLLHNWGEWDTIAAPTCSQAGHNLRICKNDVSHTDTVEVAMVAHQYAEDFTIFLSPTCEEAGKQAKFCVYGCGDSIQVEEVNAIGHSWGEWDTIAAPTCSQAGRKSHLCKNDATHTDTVEVAMVAHQYADNYTIDKEATCEESGEQSRHCIYECGLFTDLLVIEKLGHDFSEKELSATTDENGLYAYVCKRDHNHLSTTKVIKNYDGENNLELLPGDPDIYTNGLYAEELELNDGKSFYAPIAFTAQKVVFNRIADADTMCIIFPCDVPADKVGGEIYKLSNFNGSQLTFDKITDTLRANTPYLIYKGDIVSNTVIEALTDVEIAATTSLMEVQDKSGKAICLGVYNNQELSEEAQYYYYTLQAGKFVKADGNTTLPAFRIAMKIEKGEEASPEEILILLGGTTTSIEDDCLTDTQMSGKVNIYDCLGRAIRLNVDAKECINQLSEGVYLINHKKVVIRYPRR